MGSFIRFLPKRQDASRERPAPSASRGREAQAQAEAPRATPEQLLHGRQVPRLLQDHDGLQSRADGRALRRLQRRPMPTHGGKGKAHRRLLLQEKAALKRPPSRTVTYLQRTSYGIQ